MMKHRQKNDIPENVSKRAVVFCLAALFLLGFFAYAASIQGQFVWDDPILVTNNAYIKDISHAGKVFTLGVEAGAGGATRFYRPLLTLSFMADYALGGLRPAGYHVTNILLHVFAAWAVFWFLWSLLSDFRPAFLAAVLFVVHPVHTEAVSYISGRSDPMALAFLLCAFVFYLKSMRRPAPLTLLGLGAAYACALLSRESGLILPVLVLVYHGIFREKVRPGPFLLLVVVTVAYGAVRWWVFRDAPPAPAALPFADRWPGAFVAVVHYARLLVWPFNLHMEYGMPVFSATDPKVFLGAGLLAGLLLLVWRQRRRDRAAAFGAAWFLVGLVPVLNIFPLNAYMAEHWLYLPCVGFFLVLALLIRRFSERPAGREAGRALVVGLLVFYLALTVRQNIGYWRDPKQFYETTLKYAPESARLMTNLGHIYQGEERFDEAAALYEKAIALSPRHGMRAYSGLGAIYLYTGRTQEAIEIYRRAIVIEPGFHELYSNLGSIYDRVGRQEEARAAFETSVRLNPNSAAAHMNLGVVLSRQEATVDEAAAHLRSAIALNPNFPEAYHNLAGLYVKLGRVAEAIPLYQKAIALRPDYPQARRNLAIAERLERAREKSYP